MFYCDACAQKKKWSKSFVRSQGPCESCGKVTDCNDVPQRPQTRTSNLHRAAGHYADVLMEELTPTFLGSFKLSGEKLKEYLRSAYLRGYEDHVMEHESVKR